MKSSLLQRADHFFTSLLQRLPPPFSDPRVRTRLQAGATIALAAGFLVYLVLFSNLLAPLDRWATDLLYHPVTPAPELAIIAIDKKSLDEIGPFPWPRAIYAALLERLQSSPPRVIAIDLLFATPSPDDATFAAAMARHGNVLLATTGVEAAAFPTEPNTLPAYDVVILPDTILRDATAGVGHRLIEADSDNIVRQVATGIQASGVTYPALGLTTAAAARPDTETGFDLPGRVVNVGGVSIPVDEFGNALLNFTRPEDGISTYSFVDVFRGIVPPSVFADRVVFVGGTSTIEAENYAIPLQQGEARTHNVNLQADLANQVLSNPPLTLRRQGALGQLALTLIIALIAGLTLPLLRPLYAVALTFGYLVALLLLAFEAFNRGVIVQWLYPALALVLSAIAITTYRYFSEERRRQFLTLLFRRYVPSDSVGRVVDAIDRGELPLSGTRRMVTVLYADLRGFGTMAEHETPRDVLLSVNRAIELCLKAIQSEGGTVSKPMGDALVGIWNAPLDQPDHTMRGLNAAVALRRQLAQAQAAQPDREPVYVGIGLATGWAILGNISAVGKVEYTLVGDTVNIAARLSAFANNSQILADEATSASPPPHLVLRELSPVRVRGRKEPLAVWEVNDTSRSLIPSEEEVE